MLACCSAFLINNWVVLNRVLNSCGKRIFLVF